MIDICIRKENFILTSSQFFLKYVIMMSFFNYSTTQRRYIDAE
jgi:hypothetical protein